MSVQVTVPGEWQQKMLNSVLGFLQAQTVEVCVGEGWKLVDSDVNVSQPGAILNHLARSSGGSCFGRSPLEKAKVQQYAMFVVDKLWSVPVGKLVGTNKRTVGLFDVLNIQLENTVFVVGSSATLADYVLFGCTSLFMENVTLDVVRSLNNLTRWFNYIQHNDPNAQKLFDAKVLSLVETPLPPFVPPVGQRGGGKKDGKKKAAKKERKPKPQPVAQPIDFSRLCVQVGKVLSVQRHPDADGLFMEEIDVGEKEPRQIISGLVKFMAAEDLQDAMVLVVTNLKPATMRGKKSFGMVLAASDMGKENVELLSPPAGAVVGDCVAVKGCEQKPDEQCNPKKKIFETVQKDLSVDAEGVAHYKGEILAVGGQHCFAKTIRNGSIS